MDAATIRVRKAPGQVEGSSMSCYQKTCVWEAVLEGAQEMRAGASTTEAGPGLQPYLRLSGRPQKRSRVASPWVSGCRASHCCTFRHVSSFMAADHSGLSACRVKQADPPARSGLPGPGTRGFGSITNVLSKRMPRCYGILKCVTPMNRSF